MEAHPALRTYRFWLIALVLLLPPVFFLPPVPIDETRYLAVAWNMHLSGQWLVPWLDGFPYSDKPPMLFWLINLIWTVTGVHAWAARLLELLAAFATLPLIGSLGRRLGADRPGVVAAQWVWLGCAALAAYADAVMFDMLLTLSTLLAWRATVALDERRWLGGALVMALALGAGILIKGPVVLLVGGLPALVAPWWLPAARARPLPFYGRLLMVLVLAAALALAWALPAAAAGGQQYADAIFLRQTVGRLASSFAHARPLWWYLPILPVMLLPWVFCIGRGAPDASAGRTDWVDRFAIAAFVPAFLVFSLISGKQPHYLLPLLPALALACGVRLGSGRWRVVGWRVGVILVLIGLAVAIGLGWYMAPVSSIGAYACGAAIVVLGLLYVARRARPLPVPVAAFGMLATLGLAKLAFVLSVGPRYDVTAVSLRVAQAQRAGTPLLNIGQQHGLFTFAGRLTAPIPSVYDHAAVAAWSRAHPEGWVITSYKPFYYGAAPLYQQVYTGRRLMIWHAADVAAEAARASGKASPPNDEE